LKAKNKIANLIKPRFLETLKKKFSDIIELKIRYKYNTKINFTVLFNKNLYSFIYIKKNINEKFINKILIKETAGPIIIEIGIRENNKKK
tara:strand:+ start:444 stop:713 length:270 start_codon:yes stop_codon:yes gene_type:complete